MSTGFEQASLKVKLPKHLLEVSFTINHELVLNSLSFQSHKCFHKSLSFIVICFSQQVISDVVICFFMCFCVFSLYYTVLCQRYRADFHCETFYLLALYFPISLNENSLLFLDFLFSVWPLLTILFSVVQIHKYRFLRHFPLKRYPNFSEE